MGNGDEGRAGITQDQKRTDIRAVLDSLKGQFEMALPKICTVDRFLRVAITAMNKTPKLMDCTRESLLGCLMGCAELGIEPDGRRAHLIPYGDKCTLIIDYKGKVELAMRSGTVANIHADKVCENDTFIYDKGEIKSHVINFMQPRGKTYAYYCIVRMKDGTEKAEVMTLDEVQAIRDRSPGWKAFQGKLIKETPWHSDPDEMGKKTVFHRAGKWITLSPELRRAEELDDDRLEPLLPIPLNPKNEVAAPRSLSEPEKCNAKAEFEELMELKEHASKKVKDTIKEHLETYCTNSNKTPEEFIEDDYLAILPCIKAELR